MNQSAAFAVIFALALLAGCATRTLRLDRDATRFQVYSRYRAETPRAPSRVIPLRVGLAEVEVPVEHLRRLAVGGLDPSGRLYITLTHQDGRELGGTVPAGLVVADGPTQLAVRDLDFLEWETR